jgi:hypothetical protein
MQSTLHSAIYSYLILQNPPNKLQIPFCNINLASDSLTQQLGIPVVVVAAVVAAAQLAVVFGAEAD